MSQDTYFTLTKTTRAINGNYRAYSYTLWVGEDMDDGSWRVMSSFHQDVGGRSNRTSEVTNPNDASMSKEAATKLAHTVLRRKLAQGYRPPVLSRDWDSESLRIATDIEDARRAGLRARNREVVLQQAADELMRAAYESGVRERVAREEREAQAVERGHIDRLNAGVRPREPKPLVAVM